MLKPATDHVLGLPDEKKRLADVVAALKRSFNLCGTHEPALKLREEIGFFAAVRAYLVKASNVELIRRNAGVDWQKRDSVRAQLRLMAKRILRKHRYPPKRTAATTKRSS